MNIKESRKIRHLLDYKKYHLNENIDGENYSWKLFRKYEGWLTDNSKPIMTSETHTYKDLYKFAKQHYVPDLNKAISISSIIILFINLIISIVNIFLNIDTLRGFILGIDITTIIFMIVRLEVLEKEFKVMELEFKEEWRKIHENYKK